MNTRLTIPFTGLKRQYNNLREEILDVTDQVLTSGILMDGEHTENFEQWLCVKNSVSYAAVCHSGTQALEIIASYYNDYREKPTVLIPASTFPASGNAFIRAGWNIHFVDTNAYGIMNWDTVVRNGRYQAILGIGLYGAALPDSIKNQKGLIEDAAQHWLADNCQRHGGAAAISFDPMKNLSNYGNGGAIVTNDAKLFDYARNWTNNGKITGHAEVGTNSRMSEVDCAQLMVKSRHIDNWQNVRRHIARYWMEQFKDANLRCLIDQSNFDTHCFHKFVIDIDDRDTVADKLKTRGIETKIHYKHPLTELGVYQQYQGPNIISAASSLSRRCLSLPIYPELTPTEVEYIANSVKDVTNLSLTS